MSVLSLPSAWSRRLDFKTSSLSVCEIDIHDAGPYAAFINRNIERIARVSPTYAHADGEITESRMRAHIMDWRRERKANGGDLTLVCYGDGGGQILATIDLQQEAGAYFNVDVMGDLSLPEHSVIETIDTLTRGLLFRRLGASGARSYILPDDNILRRQFEKAGFRFVEEKTIPVAFYDTELPRRHAVYERVCAL